MDTSTERAAKSTSGKSYLSSWRKLRSKSSGTPLSTTNAAAAAVAMGAGANGASTGAATALGEKGDGPIMVSVPMTSFVPVERRGQKAARDVKTMVFEGPQKEYMGSLARLLQGVGVLGESFSPFFLFALILLRVFVATLQQRRVCARALDCQAVFVGYASLATRLPSRP